MKEKTGKMYSTTFSIVNEAMMKVSPFSVHKKLSTVEFFFELMHHDVKTYELWMKICIWNPDFERHLFTCFFEGFFHMIVIVSRDKQQAGFPGPF